MPTNHSTSSAMLTPSSRISHIRAAATSVNPCTGARSATSHGTSVAADLPGCRSVPGAQNTGFAGYSRQAGPVRPVYNADQPITALKGTGIRTAGPSREQEGHSGPCGGGIDDPDPVNGDSNQTRTLRILWMRYGPGCRRGRACGNLASDHA